MQRLVPLVLLLLAIGSGAPTTAVGQGAPLLGRSVAGTCTAPPATTRPVNPGTPRPAHTATRVAPGSEAPLEPRAPPPGTPAGTALLTRIRAAEENIADCFNAGDYDAFIALLTPNAMLAELGVSGPRATPAHSASYLILREAIISVDDAQTHADGRVSADVVFAFAGDRRRARDIFVEVNGYLLLDEVIELGLAGTPESTPAPLDAAILQSLTVIAFMPDAETPTVPVSTLGTAIGMQPGETRRLVLGVIDYEVCGTGQRCFVPVPVMAVWSVTPSLSAQIDPATGVLRIDPDAPSGSPVTVRADIEQGRHEVVTEVSVYTPEDNVLLGHWREEVQIACGSGEEVPPAEAIQELVFAVDGSFAVTWRPFESYVDYWGTYSFDVGRDTLDLTITGGNHIPSDVDGSGRFALDAAGSLLLTDLWLGTPPPETSQRHCGHRFGRG